MFDPIWYESLVKPALTPPSWLFGPVWTVLYAMMALAAVLVWRQGWERGEVKRALGVFLLQLVLNLVWSPLFFGAHKVGLALLDIVLMWVAIVWTIRLFYKLSRPAAYLLVPYLVWVSFAMYLNFALWMLNK